MYFEVNRGLAAGESSFIGETLARLGMRNIVGAQLGPFPRINPEFVVRADPDFILGGDRAWALRASLSGLGPHARHAGRARLPL